MDRISLAMHEVAAELQAKVRAGDGIYHSREFRRDPPVVL